jgi:hypothetical protein
VSKHALLVTLVLALYWACLAFAFCVDWRTGMAFVMFGAAQGGMLGFMAWNAAQPPTD